MTEHANLSNALLLRIQERITRLDLATHNRDHVQTCQRHVSACRLDPPFHLRYPHIIFRIMRQALHIP